MHRRGRKTTFQERLVISELAQAGQSDPEITAYLDCSVWTVRKWRRIFERKGRDGLTTQMGRPATGVLSTMPPVELPQPPPQATRAHDEWQMDAQRMMKVEGVGKVSVIDVTSRLKVESCPRAHISKPAAAGGLP